MHDNLVTALVSIVVAFIGLAAFATAVSPKASTSQVIQAGAGGIATDIAAAVSPVTGSSYGGGGLAPLTGFGSGIN